MAKVYQFPTPDDRQLIHRILQNFAHGKCSRVDAERQIIWIMKKLKIKKIVVNSYTVKIANDYGFDFMLVEGKGLHSKCPGCGCMPDGHAKYIVTRKENLNADKDCITVGCLECGTIYDTMAPNQWQGRGGA